MRLGPLGFYSFEECQETAWGRWTGVPMETQEEERCRAQVAWTAVEDSAGQCGRTWAHRSPSWVSAVTRGYSGGCGGKNASRDSEVCVITVT